ncbi:MAG TPA: fasciclin domain-containing protein [Micromonosporaceae bacterium]|nr:fasciclin domain-containing protein [Micromonosporaceae bacterium]
MRVTWFRAVITTAALLVPLSACDGGANPGGPAAEASSVAAVPSNTAARVEQLGAGCAAVPSDPTNPGSFEAMAKKPVAAAVAGSPALSTLAGAVARAGLTDSLNAAGALTVFAPTNGAFGEVTTSALRRDLADEKVLAGILRYHVVPARLSSEQVAGSHKTLHGGVITVSGSPSDLTVNGTSSVVCGNVQTANATIYIVDTVLFPAA